MQPVVFSVTEAKHGRCGWVRNSTEISYYRNRYSQAIIDSEKEGSPEKRSRRASTGSTKLKKKNDEIASEEIK